MKPRTKLERDLQAVIDNGELKPITAQQMAQAHRIWQRQSNKGYKMMLYTTTQRVKGMTLLKCYKAHKLGKGETFTMYQLCLIRAKRGGQTAYAGRGTNIGVIDSFSHTGELSIKNEKSWYKEYVECGYPLQSKGEADPYVVIRCENHNTYEFNDNRAETLAKIGREDMLQLMITRERGLTDKVYAAIKVAQRHHYDYNGDFYAWLNMVEMLIFAGKDYRNPAYICPADFTKTRNFAIDRYDKRIREIQAKRDANAETRRQEQMLRDEQARARMEEELERRKKQAERLAKTYATRLRKWLDMVITNGSIIIKPLQNIEEFAEEGKAMHHCVYANGYYNKKGTLILSAKDTNGKRLATIEYSITRKEIVQCRAACNQEPKDYDTICALINEAMAQRDRAKRHQLKAA